MRLTQKPLTSDFKQFIYDCFAQYSIEVMGFDGLSEDSIAFIIEESGKFIGTCVVQLFWGQLHIKYLLVDKEYRNRGIAKQLLTHVFNFGKTKGCTLAYVETMSFQAPLFYQKLGFKVELIRHGFSGGISFYYLKKDL